MAPAPPTAPDPGPWASLEPAGVDLQDFLGARLRADDPGLGFMGPRAPAAVLLNWATTTPSLPGGLGIPRRQKQGQLLKLKVPRVLTDIVGPQCCLLQSVGTSEGDRCQRPGVREQ